MIIEAITLLFEKICKDYFFKRYRIKYHPKSIAFCATLNQKDHPDYVIVQRGFFFKDGISKGFNNNVIASNWKTYTETYDLYVIQHISAFALQYSIKMIRFTGDLNLGINDKVYSYNDKLDIWQKN